MNTFSGTANPNSPKSIRIVIYLLLFIGILARLIQYFGDHSYWMDELFSVTNIEKMTMAELLTQQPTYNQVAPPGYYFIQKSILLIAGYPDEMILRLYPLLASITALILIYLIAQRFLQGIELVACIAIIISALGSWFYGVSAKPYATEQMFMAFFIFVLLIMQERRLSTWQYILISILGFIGTVSTFLGTTFLVGAIPWMFFTRFKNVRFQSLIPVAISWIAGAVLNILYTQTVIASRVEEAMTNAHDYGFPPGNIIEFPLWLWHSLIDSFNYFLNLILPVPTFLWILLPIIFLLSGIGIYFLFRKDKIRATLLALPLLMLVALAIFRILPLNNRFGSAVLWLLPLLAMYGVYSIRENVKFVKPWMSAAIAVLIALPNTFIILAGISGLPIDFDPTEELLSRVKKDLKPDEQIIVHPRAYLQMDYYAPKAGIDEYRILDNDTTVAILRNTFQELKGERAWFIVTNVLEFPSKVTVEEYDSLLTKMAKPVKEHKLAEDTYGNLYRFTE